METSLSIIEYQTTETIQALIAKNTAESEASLIVLQEILMSSAMAIEAYIQASGMSPAKG